MHADPTHLTALFENATEGIILTDGGGNIILINPAGQRMFGYNAEELIGKPIETLVPASVRPGHTHLRKTFYDHPQNRVMGHGRDLYGKRKDNTELPLEVSLGFYTRNEELFVIAFIVDITTRKTIENSVLAQKKELEKMAFDMQQMNAELEAKVEERTLILKEALQKLEQSQQELSEALEKEKQLSEIKSSFVSLASHEFRIPLSTVLSSAALIGRYVQTDDQDKREKHIKRIKDSVKHLNDILEDFLSLGKLEEGKIEAQPELFNVSDFLNDLMEEFSDMEKPGQRIQLTCEVLDHFVTDKKLLRNIVINLLGNAIKFSDENSTVQLEAYQQDGKLRILVKDEGIGISVADQDQLFDSFFRGKNASNIQGTGLGLHIVKKYLELLRGTISLNSVIDKGTTFIIEIPDLSGETQ